MASTETNASAGSSCSTLCFLKTAKISQTLTYIFPGVMILFTDKYMLAIGMLASFIYAAVEFCIMQRKSHKYPYYITVYIAFRLLVVSADGGFFINALIGALYAETDT